VTRTAEATAKNVEVEKDAVRAHQVEEAIVAPVVNTKSTPTPPAVTNTPVNAKTGIETVVTILVATGIETELSELNTQGVIAMTEDHRVEKEAATESSLTTDEVEVEETEEEAADEEAEDSVAEDKTDREAQVRLASQRSQRLI
jgi:hypothetical protein